MKKYRSRFKIVTTSIFFVHNFYFLLNDGVAKR